MTYNGRRYAVVGFTPLAVIPFRVELADAETNTSVWIEWPPTDAAKRVALRLLSTTDNEHGLARTPAVRTGKPRAASAEEA